MTSSEFNELLNKLEITLRGVRKAELSDADAAELLKSYDFTPEQAVVWERCIYPVEYFDVLHPNWCDGCMDELEEAVGSVELYIDGYKSGTLGRFKRTLSVSYCKQNGDHTQGISAHLGWMGGKLVTHNPGVANPSSMNVALFDAVNKNPPRTTEEFLSLELPEDVNGYTLGKDAVSYWGVFENE